MSDITGWQAGEPCDCGASIVAYCPAECPNRDDYDGADELQAAVDEHRAPVLPVDDTEEALAASQKRDAPDGRTDS